MGFKVAVEKTVGVNVSKGIVINVGDTVGVAEAETNGMVETTEATISGRKVKNVPPPKIITTSKNKRNQNTERRLLLDRLNKGLFDLSVMRGKGFVGAEMAEMGMLDAVSLLLGILPRRPIITVILSRPPPALAA